MGIENLDIKEFKEFIRKEKNVSDVCAKFDISILEFGCIVSRLKTKGINIIVTGKGDETTVLNLDERNLGGDNIYTIDIGDETEFKALLLSDTRIGSIYEQPSRLNETYYNAFTDGYNKAILLGDITEGLYSKRNKYFSSLYLPTTEEQVERVINYYPYIEGMTTYFITGDQDLTHTTKNGVDIGRLISERREDMIYLGQMSCVININKMKILANHLKVGAFDRAKTVSYKQQEYMYSMRSEDKADIILNGHLLVDEQLDEREMTEISVPSLVATTPRIKSNGVTHNVGSTLLNCSFTKYGKLEKVNAIVSPYYQTDQDDYLRAKVLKMGG